MARSSQTSPSSSTPTEEDKRVEKPKVLESEEMEMDEEQELLGSPIHSSARSKSDSEMHDGDIESHHEFSDLEAEVSKLRLVEKLNGAQRKKKKWLMLRGHSAEEATRLCKQKIPPKSERVKRPRSETTTPEGAEKKKARNTETSTKEGKQLRPKKEEGKSDSTAPRSYRQALEGIKVGILHANFPEVLLDNEQLGKIQGAILKLILAKKKDDQCRPGFQGTQWKPGYLIVSCNNERTAEWLIASENTLIPWEGATLKVVKEADIPRNKIVTAYIPNSAEDSNETILDLIESQNLGLKATGWKVLRRTEEGKVSLLTMAIDNASASQIEKDGPTVYYKFSTVQLRLRGKGSTAQGGEPKRKLEDKKHEPVAEKRMRTETTTSAKASTSASTSAAVSRGSSGNSSSQSTARGYNKKKKERKVPLVEFFRKDQGDAGKKNTSPKGRRPKSPQRKRGPAPGESRGSDTGKESP